MSLYQFLYHFLSSFLLPYVGSAICGVGNWWLPSVSHFYSILQDKGFMFEGGAALVAMANHLLASELVEPLSDTIYYT